MCGPLTKDEDSVLPSSNIHLKHLSFFDESFTSMFIIYVINSKLNHYESTSSFLFLNNYESSGNLITTCLTHNIHPSE